MHVHVRCWRGEIHAHLCDCVRAIAHDSRDAGGRLPKKRVHNHKGTLRARRVRSAAVGGRASWAVTVPEHASAASQAENAPYLRTREL